MSDEIVKKFALPSRYSDDGKSIWTEYNELRELYNAIDIGIGVPDFLPPQFVRDALKEVASSTHNVLHQYTRGYGHPRLVKALAKIYSSKVGREIDPYTEIAVTLGAYHAIFTSIMAIVDQGDEVIIIEPFFESYAKNVRSAGGLPRFISLQLNTTSSRWELDLHELESLFSQRTKAIIVNTPHNPLGKVFSLEELTAIADLCKRFNVVCISDEVYEWLVYDGKTHTRMASLPGMWERTVTLCSAGKTFGTTGWKLGWAYGPAYLIKNLHLVHHNCVRASNTFLQESAAICLESPERERYFAVTAKELERKRNFMYNFLEKLGMEPVLSDGGYFMVANWTSLEGKIDLSGENDSYKDYRITKWLLKNCGVQALPCTPFYSKSHKSQGEKFIRFCFVKTDERLEKAAKSLEQLLKL